MLVPLTSSRHLPMTVTPYHPYTTLLPPSIRKAGQVDCRQHRSPQPSSLRTISVHGSRRCFVSLRTPKPLSSWQPQWLTSSSRRGLDELPSPGGNHSTIRNSNESSRPSDILWIACAPENHPSRRNLVLIVITGSWAHLEAGKPL